MKPFLAHVLMAETVPAEAPALESAGKWPVLQHLPLRLSVKIPLVGVALRGLCEMKVGMLMSSEWPASEEVPLYANNVTLGWCEFEVVEGKIAVRLTRLS